MTKAKPWRVEVGLAIGFAVGVFLWSAGGEPFKLAELCRLIVGPSVVAIAVISASNKLKRVGPYDPEVLARNKGGVV